MFSEGEFEAARPDAWRRVGYAGMGVLRVTLLFGSAVVALALLAAPIVADHTRTLTAQANSPFGIDPIVTGSIDAGGSYTIRRSVLQSSPTAVCVIRDNGSRSGDC